MALVRSPYFLALLALVGLVACGTEGPRPEGGAPSAQGESPNPEKGTAKETPHDPDKPIPNPIGSCPNFMGIFGAKSPLDLPKGKNRALFARVYRVKQDGCKALTLGVTEVDLDASENPIHYNRMPNEDWSLIPGTTRDENGDEVSSVRYERTLNAGRPDWPNLALILTRYSWVGDAATGVRLRFRREVRFERTPKDDLQVRVRDYLEQRNVRDITDLYLRNTAAQIRERFPENFQ